MTDTFVDAKVQRIQVMLYAKASHEPQTRFNRLYKYLTRREWVRAATNHVLSNRGSRTAGIDGMTRASYQDVAKHEALVQTIQEELATQTYCPVAVRRTFIPKANGKKRPLGIPTIKDRVVQQMVKMLIEPIYEATFLPCSYGFRPNRCTWDAIANAHHMLAPKCNYYTVIEGDIENCFGTIQHGKLMAQLRRRILDEGLLALIWKMLRAGVMEDLQYAETTEGTPQGGLVSPLLANVYMHKLDEWFHQRFHDMNNSSRWWHRQKGELVSVRYIRYADDFVVLMRDAERADELKQELANYIRKELEMTLSESKTLISDARTGFDFLGVRVMVKPQRSNPSKLLPYQIPSKKSVDAYRQKVRVITHSDLDYVAPAERIRSLNWLIEGWANYHHWGNAKQTFSALSQWTIRKVHTMLRRYMPKGKMTTYREFFHPVAECDNLAKWHKYVNWLTPSVEVGGTRIGLLPMSLVSTSEYWRFRGAKIPPAFPLLGEEVPMKQRKKAEFYTDTEIIENTTIGQASRRNKGKYNAVYFINRPIVLQRDEFTCVVCGYKSKRQKGQVNDLEVHHIDPNGGSHTDNLQTVCLECHRRLTAIEQAI